MSESEKWLKQLRAEGQRCFTDANFSQAMGLGLAQTRRRIGRLRHNKLIFSPKVGFHVIVPYENSSSGAVHPELFIDQLCSYMKRQYYVSTLTAAMYHGSSHQKPMVYQVCVNKLIQGKMPGDYPVELIQNSELAIVPIIKRKCQSGYINVSDVNATCYDLVRFHSHSGGMSNVCTVIAELLEDKSMNDISWESPYFSMINILQRLGFILDLLDLKEHSESLFKSTRNYQLNWTPLIKSKKTKGSSRNERWKIIVNETLEPDL